MSNIITLSTQNQQITFQRAEDGYINATALCQNACKQIGSYLRNTTTDAFLKELEADMQISITELVQIQRGGEPHLQGTWVHPQVAIHLSQWLSPKFAVQVSRWVSDWIVNKQVPQIREYTKKELLLMALENEERIEALENTVQKKDQEIQVLGYEKEVVEKNLEIKTAEVKEKEIVIEKARATFKQVADKNGCVGFRDCATQLCIPQKQLRELLEKNKMICPKAKDSKGNKILKPTVGGASYGYVKHATKDGVKLQNGKTAKEFLITEKGFAKLLNQVSGI
jgi:phage antirepressor YoqD-like protein